MKTTNHNVQRLLLAVMLLGMAACTGDFADINRNPNEVTDEQLQANNYKIGTNLKTLQGLVVPTQEHMYQFLESLVGGPYAGYIGATVDTWQNKFETRHVAEQVRDLQCFGRLAEVALRERHQRDLPGLPRHHQRYGRRNGPRACRCLPHCNHAARDGFLRSDSLHADHGRQDRIARSDLRYAAGGLCGDVRGTRRGDCLAGGQSHAAVRRIRPLRRGLCGQYRAVAEVRQLAEAAHGHAPDLRGRGNGPHEGCRSDCRPTSSAT